MIFGVEGETLIRIELEFFDYFLLKTSEFHRIWNNLIIARFFHVELNDCCSSQEMWLSCCDLKLILDLNLG